MRILKNVQNINFFSRVIIHTQADLVSKEFAPNKII